MKYPGSDFIIFTVVFPKGKACTTRASRYRSAPVKNESSALNNFLPAPPFIA